MTKLISNKRKYITKKEAQKVIEQCKEELELMYIKSEVFDYEVTIDDIVWGTEVLTLSILVKKDGDIYYQFQEVYIDEDFNILQRNIRIG